jgi:hypothetical protein
MLQVRRFEIVGMQGEGFSGATHHTIAKIYNCIDATADRKFP